MEFIQTILLCNLHKQEHYQQNCFTPRPLIITKGFVRTSLLTNTEMDNKRDTPLTRMNASLSSGSIL